jgi:hypothetical protein
MTLTKGARLFLQPGHRWLRVNKSSLSPASGHHADRPAGHHAAHRPVARYHRLNFIFWGLWHGLGLFVQNRYFRLGQTHHLRRGVVTSDWGRKALGFGGLVFDLHFVAFGWVLVLFAGCRLCLAGVRRSAGFEL